jgi:hypothetical protein
MRLHALFLGVLFVFHGAQGEEFGRQDYQVAMAGGMLTGFLAGSVSRITHNYIVPPAMAILIQALHTSSEQGKCLVPTKDINLINVPILQNIYLTNSQLYMNILGALTGYYCTAGIIHGVKAAKQACVWAYHTMASKQKHHNS